MDNLQERCIDAAEKYLLWQDNDIVAKNFSEKVDIIVKDWNGDLHFIRVKGFERGPKLKDQQVSSKLRAKMEQGMFEFISQNDKYLDVSVHFDLMLFYKVSSENRAFLTYIKDCAKY